MPTIITLVDGTVPVAADFNTSLQNLNQAIGTGTAITSYTTGDTLYASAANTLSKLAIGSTGQVLTVSGGIPAWSSAAKSLSAVRGLIGNTTATTIVLTSADAVTLRNSNDQTVIHTSVGSLTLDAATSGLNGRDQSGAFTASQDLHAYYISDGTNLRTVLADAAPMTGPDLTTLAGFSGYTYWAYIGAFYWNSGSNFILARIRGSKVLYEAGQSALADGSATTEATVSLSTLVPAKAATILLHVHLDATSSSGAGASYLRYITGSNYFPMTLISSGSGQADAIDAMVEIPNVSQQCFYIVFNAANDLDIDVMGYTVPNGGA